MLINGKPKPFREFAMGHSMPLSPSKMWDMRRWYSPEGENEDDAHNLGYNIKNPYGLLRQGRSFDPLNVLLVGRKGCGKTLCLTTLAGIYDASFHSPSLGSKRGLRRVASNYFVDFLQARGPLGMQRETVVDDQGIPRLADVPVDPCDQPSPCGATTVPSSLTKSRTCSIRPSPTPGASAIGAMSCASSAISLPNTWLRPMPPDRSRTKSSSISTCWCS